MNDLQKASMWKRMSAWLFDLILFATVVTLVAIPISVIFKYNEKVEVVEKVEAEYREEMIKDGLNPDITEQELNSLSKEEREKYTAVDQRRAKDDRLGIGYAMITNIIITMIFVSIFVAYLVLEFFVPLFLKNGQTLGKKIFGIGVVHTNLVKFGSKPLFIRSMIGKCAIETMVPVFLVMMILFGSLGLIGAVVLLLLLVLQIYAVASTRTNSAIHDLVADAAVVDLSSQMIFESHEQLMEYKNRVHKEAADKAEYR